MTPSNRPEDVLPLLVVVFEGLADEDPPLLFAEAADRVCRLLRVLPHGDEADRATQRFLRGLGTIVDVSGMTVADAAAVIGGHEPRGIVCFNDGNLVWTSKIADRPGLKFFKTQTSERLTDMLQKRTALRNRGLPTPDFWNLDEVVASPVAAVGPDAYPLVMKPRRGRGPMDTAVMHSPEELEAAIKDVTPCRMMLECYVPDLSAPVTGAGNTPFASVELVMSDGIVSVLDVTGKPPLAPPFRETGHLFPADLTRDLEERLIEAAVSATRALGVETGVLHVEVKCTDAGPVIIEVNGCMGGGEISGLILNQRPDPAGAGDRRDPTDDATRARRTRCIGDSPSSGGCRLPLRYPAGCQLPSHHCGRGTRLGAEHPGPRLGLPGRRPRR